MYKHIMKPALKIEKEGQTFGSTRLFFICFSCCSPLRWCWVIICYQI